MRVKERGGVATFFHGQMAGHSRLGGVMQGPKSRNACYGNVSLVIGGRAAKDFVGIHIKI